MTRLTNKMKKETLYNWVNAKKKKQIVKAFDLLGSQYSALIAKTYPLNRQVCIENKQLVADGFISTINSAQLPYRFQQKHIDSGVVCDILSFRDNSIGRKSFTIEPIACSSKYFDPKEHVDMKKAEVIFNRFKDKMNLIQVDIRNVESVLYSVTTVKKLTDILPEFSKYVPKPEIKSTQLIAIDLVSTVRGLL
jgi:hypothetical protein